MFTVFIFLKVVIEYKDYTPIVVALHRYFDYTMFVFPIIYFFNDSKFLENIDIQRYLLCFSSNFPVHLKNES